MTFTSKITAITRTQYNYCLEQSTSGKVNRVFVKNLQQAESTVNYCITPDLQ